MSVQGDDDELVFNTKGLDQLLKALTQNPPTGQIGILGDSARNGSTKEPTNALIGAVHEFGSLERGIPARSWLRVPIAEQLPAYLNKAGAFDEAVLKEVVKTGSFVPWLRKCLAIAELVVSDGFDSNGFGKWAKWKNPNYENNTGQVLVDTQQLRNSVTTRVQGGE